MNKTTFPKNTMLLNNDSLVNVVGGILTGVQHAEMMSEFWRTFEQTTYFQYTGDTTVPTSQNNHVI